MVGWIANALAAESSIGIGAPALSPTISMNPEGTNCTWLKLIPAPNASIPTPTQLVGEPPAQTGERRSNVASGPTLPPRHVGGMR